MTTGRAVWMGLGVAFLAMACGRDVPAPAAAERVAPVAARHGATPPLVMEVAGPEVVQAGETIVVRLELRRAGPSAPIALHVDVPEGVSVMEGDVDETIGDDGVLVVRRSLRLGVTSVPAGDVRVTASSGGPGWGVRAEGAYRFGRAAPGAPVVRRGDEVVLPGGRGLGAPVVVELAARGGAAGRRGANPHPRPLSRRERGDVAAGGRRCGAWRSPHPRPFGEGRRCGGGINRGGA